MAEEQKTVEEQVAPVVLPKTEGAPIEPKIEELATAEDKPGVTEDKPIETTEDPLKEEAKTEEVKPVEEGHLGYKAQGLSFPKNLFPSKAFFFFGTEAFEPKTLAAYQKNEKSTETAHHNISWASHTGKGLLFHGEKTAPTGVINLSDASEPEVDGSNKFHLTTKGNKHSFKASSTAERDNWVAQLKLKIAEAKELATSVVEGETFKKTLDSFKPAPVEKEEPKAEEVAKTEEAPKEEEAAPVEEAAKEEPTKEEPKRRSASRKRASFFGFGKKDDKKDVKEELSTAADEEPVKTEEVPASEAPVAIDSAALTEPAAHEEAATATEDKPTDEDHPTEELETPKDKSSKRNSFFGVFSKKEKKAAEVKPTEASEATEGTEAAAAPVPVTEDAPELPPVETASTPLDAGISSPATVPTEVVEVIPADVKKDVKEKRKSSLPFAFGKREKSPAVEGEDKAEKTDKAAKPGAFSKLRATMRGRSGKADDKPAEVATETPVKEELATEETPAEIPAETTSEVKPTETAEVEPEIKPETISTSIPAVTATA